jgi:hypothetical protein
MMTEIDNYSTLSEITLAESDFGDIEQYKEKEIMGCADFSEEDEDDTKYNEEDEPTTTKTTITENTEETTAITAWNILHNSKLLVDPTGIMRNNLFDKYGITKPSNLVMIAKNIPMILNEFGCLLKIVPKKEFMTELQSYNTLNKSPFCPVCRDKGLPASEYTSHHIWADEERKCVICPTLLMTTCNLCKQKGHSPKYCTQSDTTKQQINQLSSSTPCKLSIPINNNNNNNNQIISRMILPTTCRTCNKLGHTSTYCKQLIFTNKNKIPYLSVFPTLSSEYMKNKPKQINPITFSTMYVQNTQIHEYIQSATQFLRWSQDENIDKITKQYYLEQSIYYTKTAESYVNKYYLECFHNFEVL